MQYDSDLNFNYFGPTKVVFGTGSIAEIPMEVATLGKKAFLVTDQGIKETGLADQVTDRMGDLLAGVYSDVPQDSGMEVVDKGAEAALAAGADVLVSLGGGSVIDTAKGMCIVMKEGGSLRDFQGMQMLTRSQIPHIVVPTTAGTGSEVTSGAVVMDQEQGQKVIIFEYFNTPRVAILDPRMTEMLPPGLTATTGMDAMTHAVESYVSQQRNPISDGSLTILNGVTGHGGLNVTADSGTLMNLSNQRIKWGLPYYFDETGKEILAAMKNGRLKVEGMLRHFTTLIRFSRVMSVH